MNTIADWLVVRNMKHVIKSDVEDQKDKNVIGIVCTANSLWNFLDKYYNEFNLTSRQYNVLCILRLQYPVSITLKCIREKIVGEKSDISRLLKRLQKQGLVLILISSTDRRAVDITISKSGLELLAHIDTLGNINHRATKFLSNEESTLLNELLIKVLAATGK